MIVCNLRSSRCRHTLVFSLLLAVLLNSATGCGGGTRGTGVGGGIGATSTADAAQLIRGTVINVEGATIQGVIATVVETGVSAVSDESGVFLLDLSGIGDSEFTLEFLVGDEVLVGRFPSVQEMGSLTVDLSNRVVIVGAVAENSGESFVVELESMEGLR